jgi:hypothetical protein
MEKSHVTMERLMCIVCGKEFDSGNLLLDTRMRKQFDKHTTTGYGLCEEHKKLHEDGYLALIVCDESKSKPVGDGLKNEDAHRTGEIIHIRRTAFKKIFTGVSAEAINGAVMFLSSETAEQLKQISQGG